MKKKLDKDIVDIIENITNEALENLMSSLYAEYAKYIIQDRAIPDVRDGLKPVQRRIIYSMYLEKNDARHPMRKCAHTVGAVMGKYHPHGDGSIYDALVRMSQDWKTMVPLIDFQGNNGSVDGDGAAAYRYTESRLSEISDYLTKDLDKKTVDMQLTFDDSHVEPIVLPSYFPNLLVSGSEGIAVGVATNIPTHNLQEVIAATIYRIKNPNCRLETLRSYLPAPDFATGGVIYKSSGLDSLYQNGRGRIEIGSTYRVSHGKTPAIHISEIPYGVNKIQLVYEIDKIIHAKKIDGMLEVRDESDMHGISIVIDLKHDAKSDLIINYLLKNTPMLSAFNANVVAIVNGRPKTLGLIEIIDAYIAHQVSVITRRSEFDLKKSQFRLHIVVGLIKAIINIDEVVRIIKQSKDKTDAKLQLMARFDFSKEQAEAIVMLPLYRLNSTDVSALEAEKRRLEEIIAELENILANRETLDNLLVNELRTVAKTFNTPRRSQLADTLEVKPIDERDLIVREQVMFALTKDGYLKRSSMKSLLSSGGEDCLPGIKESDLLVFCGKVMTTDYILAFTNLGNYIYIPVYLVKEGKWKDEGQHLNYLSTTSGNEKIIKAICVSEFRNDLFIALVTAKGQIKKTFINEFEVSRFSRPINCMRLMSEDEVVDVHVSHGNDDLFILTSDGKATFFNETEVAPTGLKSSGIKGISGLKGAKIVGFYPLEADSRARFVLITDMGHQRVLEPYRHIEITKRLGKAQEAFKTFKSDPHNLIFIQRVAPDKEAMNITMLNKDGSTFSVLVSDFNLTPMDKYARANIEGFKPRQEFVDSYEYDREYVNKATKSHLDPKLLAANVKSVCEEQGESAKKNEQMNIFDFMGD